MAQVNRTRRANADLDEIWLHVALDNPVAADRLVDRIVSRCRDLAEHPRLGQARPEIAPGARILIVDDCLVLYRVESGDVEIVRVVHGARRLEGLFDPNTGTI
jgi:toxin ParE1/3/4